MKDLMTYYVAFAKFIWYKIIKVTNVTIIGRIFEGISIGLYVNIIDRLIEGNMSLDLIYKIFVAIIFTTIGVLLQKKEKIC